jgi:hypothetical protein
VKEETRWRLARRLLRAAGWLLSKSHPDVLNAQTSARATITQHPDWPTDVRVRLSALEDDKPRAYFTRDLHRTDAHGLLLQLAVASYQADRAHETRQVERAAHRSGSS